MQTPEDTFDFPAGWLRHRFARRGGSGPATFTPDKKARAFVDAELTRRAEVVRPVLEAPATPGDLRADGLAWLDGQPGVSPAGAAAVALAVTLGNWQAGDKLVAFADVWLAEQGPVFAARAAVELMSLETMHSHGPVLPGVAQRYGVRRMLPGHQRHSWQADVQMQILLRVRTALAAASGEQYREAVAALAGHRQGHLYARAAVATLVPTETAWVEQAIADTVAAQDTYLANLLTAAAGDGRQFGELAPLAGGWTIWGSIAMLSTIADGVGAAAAPALFGWFDADSGDADAMRRLLSVLAVLPGDDVMAGLVERAGRKYVTPYLLEAADRYPRRGLRLLAESGRHDDLLRAHLLNHPGLAGEVLPELSAAAAARVEAITAEAASLVTAPIEAVPPVLADPPWERRVKAAKPVVIAGLTCDDVPATEWLPGEREAWRATPIRHYDEPKESWEELAHRMASGKSQWNDPVRLFIDGPDDVARRVLHHWRPTYAYDADSWMRVATDRFETAFLPVVVSLARQSPGEYAPLLAPFTSPEVAVLMAGWLARLKTTRQHASQWLLRHPAAAARALVPPALQKPGAARREAEQALLALAVNGHGDAVRAAAETYGAQAAAAIGVLLGTDPLSVLPAKMPPVPSWAVPGLLPPVRLRDGSGALPPEAVTSLVSILAISRLDDPYAGLALVRESCDPSSLAEFGWGLFQRWQTAGANSKENWALSALGLIGDDETVRRLTPLILAWPGDGGHAKAVTGVNILAAIGSDVALMRLHGIAQRAKFKGLKNTANEKMAEVAAGLGLSAEQLADRLVPDFGLDAAGSLRLDYGGREFTVGFDEQLRPYVADGAGKRLKALPKPGARDDAELAPQAYKQFSALKKDVRTVATDQVRRLERAMVTGRRWSAGEFQQLFVDHPLLWHIVRRLVWAVWDADAEPLGAIRVAEDRTFSTVDDDETTLPDDATVGVAHPLHLGGDLAAWSELFADYEILQPFPQLSRQTFALSAEEAASSRLTRFESVTVPTTKLLGLERRGWRREAPQDGGMQSRIELAVADGVEVAVEFEPGIAVGYVGEFEDQKITMVMLHNGTGSRWHSDPRGQIALRELDPVVASEIIRDLTEVTA
ncbi:DUF4132 domain-containing protein [Paractinoplanes atraurantiacus]|uniref:DUF4132 domain-containing protein n=1 Tax=Paractinoplanes atraurantiacus TaxID=1036182 RepID=A0A285J2G9_9ACTN|nr:DUF4132 domain-containing protein [Actinoplanes atraurantiacus]SNY54520.1 protein of unknown function [Actinoplanes atraurantiacus]